MIRDRFTPKLLVGKWLMWTVIGLQQTTMKEVSLKPFLEVNDVNCKRVIQDDPERGSNFKALWKASNFSMVRGFLCHIGGLCWGSLSCMEPLPDIMVMYLNVPRVRMKTDFCVSANVLGLSVKLVVEGDCLLIDGGSIYTENCSGLQL